ncbi:MAG: UDP-glucose 4-epimerase GalE [Proteobacteria bacterium]|jgi:UDP-glucose 4-epimerase|nr:UDP-glucose 4-epimerase GalE [Pseudomonadota bacterium]
MKECTILVTGGAGYIGSHTVIELLNNNCQVIIVDDLSNSNKKVLDRIEKITGVHPIFYPISICDKDALSLIFTTHKINAVIHFAAFKAVGESVQKPLDYYKNNVSGCLLLLQIMQEYSVKTIVFSSSATVYGQPKEVPVKENSKISPQSPYGFTKMMIEQILTDIYHADKSWNIAILRYFNPVGAHRSGLIGENPNGIPNNLMPYIAQVATGKLDYLQIFGNDYITKDGTGVRDYIHVVDLAIGHIKALKYFDFKSKVGQMITLNLGTGIGCSVLDVVKTFEKASGKSIPYKILPRRSGDVAEYYADATLAKQVLGFQTRFNLDDMCCDTWRWQINNPEGY